MIMNHDICSKLISYISNKNKFSNLNLNKEQTFRKASRYKNNKNYKK